MKTKVFVFLLFFLVFLIPGKSQVECRSRLGRFLKPIHKNFPLQWAVEIAPAYGYLNDRKIFNGLTLIGFDYSKKNSQLYFEGGVKYWSIREKNVYSINKIGLRECFYKHLHNKNEYSLGFQSTKLGDYFLVDERAFSGIYKHQKSNYGINLSVGSVIKDWSRMGSYCNVKYIYSMLKEDIEEIVGNKIGETNFAGLVLTWKPSDTKKTETTVDTSFSNFENNEFTLVNDTLGEFNNSTVNEVLSRNTLKSFKLSQMGIVLYNEFGKSFGKTRFYAGPLFQFNLPLEIILQTELLFQGNDDYKALLEYLRLSRNIDWNSSSFSTFEFSWIGIHRIIGNSFFGPAFGNYYMGEILRLDIYDSPMFQISARHTFPGKSRFYIKFKYVKQLEKWKADAYDFEANIKIWKHIRLAYLFSYLKTIRTKKPSEIILSRVELRFSF